MSVAPLHNVVQHHCRPSAPDRSNAIQWRYTRAMGWPELVLVLVIVLLVFGAGKLTGLGDSLGRMVRNIRHAASDSDASRRDR